MLSPPPGKVEWISAPQTTPSLQTYEKQESRVEERSLRLRAERKWRETGPGWSTNK